MKKQYKVVTGLLPDVENFNRIVTEHINDDWYIASNGTKVVVNVNGPPYLVIVLLRDH